MDIGLGKFVLPPNWIAKTSTKHPDHMYYFNLATGETQWDPPIEKGSDTQKKHPSILNKVQPKQASVSSDAQRTKLIIGGSEIKEDIVERVVPTAVVAPVIPKQITASSSTALRAYGNRTLIPSKDSSASDNFSTNVKFPFKNSLAPSFSLNQSAISPGESRRATCAGTSKSLCNQTEKPLKKCSSVENTKQQVGAKRKRLSEKCESPSRETKRGMWSMGNTSTCTPQQTMSGIWSMGGTPTYLSQETMSGMWGMPNMPVQSMSNVLQYSTQDIEDMEQELTTYTSSESASDSDIDALRNTDPQDPRTCTEDIPRVNFSLIDIEMTDVNIPITEMNTVINSDSYHIVVDTNIFIDEIKSIDEIKDLPIADSGPPHIVIPWIVMLELDSLKKNSKNGALVKSVTEAVHYLNKVLTSKHPRFHCQKPVKRPQDVTRIYTFSNDDIILDFCLSIKEKIPVGKLICLSNDKNLRNKLIIADDEIKAYDFKSLMAKLWPELKMSVKDSKGKRRFSAEGKKQIDKMLKKVSDKVLKSFQVSKPREQSRSQFDSQFDSCKQARDNCKQEIEKLMLEARQMLKNVLRTLLEEEMQEAYGDIWRRFKIDLNLLKGILQAYIKYWMMVFSLKLKEKDKHNFTFLLEKLEQPEGLMGDKDECLSILNSIEDIFGILKRRWLHLDVPLEKFQEIRSSCIEVFQKLTELESSITTLQESTEAIASKQVLQAFEHNWLVINHMCAVAMDAGNLDHNFTYNKPTEAPDKSDLLRVLPRLLHSLEELKDVLLKVINVIESSSNNRVVFKHLYRHLTQLVPSLNLNYPSPTLSLFTKKALEAFCRAPENRSKLHNGQQQIETYHKKLNEAIYALLAS